MSFAGGGKGREIQGQGCRLCQRAQLSVLAESLEYEVNVSLEKLTESSLSPILKQTAFTYVSYKYLVLQKRSQQFLLHICMYLCTYVVWGHLHITTEV